MLAQKIARKRVASISIRVLSTSSTESTSDSSPPPRKRPRLAKPTSEDATLPTPYPSLTSADGKTIPVESVLMPANVSSLVENLERDTMGKSWYNTLQAEFKAAYFRKLKDFLVSEHKAHTIFPSISNVYSWSRLTPLDAVKVVILGQDPYHDVNQAHGLAFSVLSPTRPPPSLKNIYKQIQTDIPSFAIPSTGDLTPLATRGVLFLNSALTVRAHKANSHAKKGWEQLTTAALRAVAQREGRRGVVFFAWGLPAQKTCKAVGIDETKHLVLRSAHPSPLSAYRGFFGNHHFKKANDWLEQQYGPGEGIDWAALHD